MKDHEQIPWHVGNVIRLNPECWGYKSWSAAITSGPFIVTKIDLEHQDRCEIRRMADGKVFACGVPRPWWAILDPFLDAAMKANKSNE